ncbi:hypothetical protein CJ030_MR3G012332 [Morella rubra]|uniref:F-box domain-containing protein n=1 Tax=Morella rubra TaxID=262757 RepID=A0A6A1W5D4_9ROSI|nr:hypothetical protein CJ030_MR3G012332 [Morella rubra]
MSDGGRHRGNPARCFILDLPEELIRDILLRIVRSGSLGILSFMLVNRRCRFHVLYNHQLVSAVRIERLPPQGSRPDLVIQRIQRFCAMSNPDVLFLRGMELAVENPVGSRDYRTGRSMLRCISTEPLVTELAAEGDISVP